MGIAVVILLMEMREVDELCVSLSLAATQTCGSFFVMWPGVSLLLEVHLLRRALPENRQVNWVLYIDSLLNCLRKVWNISPM